nr:LacI family DNA-binding transcriptional regulator [Fructilactobacillus florum]
MKKTTINDIAKAAGVSKTTVSRYLNKKICQHVGSYQKQNRSYHRQTPLSTQP